MLPKGLATSAPPKPLPAAIEVREAEARPTVNLLVREGDPASAIALAVVTEGGSAEATALAAIVETRLEGAGFPVVTTQAERDGYRLRALVSTPKEAAAFARALGDALLTPIAEGSEEVARAGRRLESLRRHPLPDPALEAIARCTGRLGVLPGEPALDPTSKAGLAKLEASRRKAHAISRLSLGVVGPRKVGDAVLEAMAASKPWPKGSLPKASWPDRDVAHTHASGSEPSGKAKITVALRVDDAPHAKLAAERLGDPRGALALRLEPTLWQLTEVVATARLEGGCLSASLEASKPLDKLVPEEEAAHAAALLRRELEAELSRAKLDAADPWASALDASDPRDAAELAAFWSLTARAPARSRPLRAAIAAALPPPAESDSPKPSSARSERFAQALARAERAHETQVVEPRIRIEPGQNRLFVLVGSPCGLASESSADAGVTALAIMAAALGAEGDPRAGVTIEPWLSPDGVGLLAHAPRLPGESADSLAIRVAEEAARAFVSAGHRPAGFARARSLLIAKLAGESATDADLFEIAAQAIAPSHPSWLSPFGSLRSLIKLGAEAAALRNGALLAGPLRVAVLADESASQGELVARTLDRWFSRHAETPRTCPLPSARREPASGMFQLELAKEARARALLAFPAPGPASADRESAAIAVRLLDQKDGLLDRALRSLPGASARAKLVGGELASALVVELTAKEELLDDAIAQIRGLLQRLAEGGLADDDLERAMQDHRQKELESLLDPRRRIADLFHGREPAITGRGPSFEAVRAFLRGALRDDQAVLVVARPRP